MTVSDALLGDLNFNVKPEFKFEKLAKKWCQHQQLDPKTIRFLTEDGQRIQNNSLVKDVSVFRSFWKFMGLMWVPRKHADEGSSTTA